MLVVLFSGRNTKLPVKTKLARILAGLTSWHAREPSCLVLFCFHLVLFFVPAELLGDVTVVVDAATRAAAIEPEDLAKIINRNDSNWSGIN